jgi:Caspase domain
VSGQRKALIVANDEYEQEALRDLRAPAADAEALGRVLADPQIGDFAVQVVRNEPAHVIEAQIEDLFSESRPDDVLLLHFSGHGLKSESGELFFAASNTRPNRLGSTAVSADFVQRCMRDSRSRSVVLLLDCCYGGAFAQGVKVRAAGDANVLDSFPQGKSGGGRGRAVITASSAMEFAFEGDQLGDDQQPRPSVFTTALVEGLATGEADQDQDGWVSLDELYDYVFDKVREENPHQTPGRQVELEGELYLARSRRRRIHPAPIPPDLQTALADPNMYTRLGAVSELRSRLASDNLPIAAGAYQALAQLVISDISYVAGPAAEALSDVGVQPAQRELHFGRVEPGSAPPHQRVQLLGPSIARACVPHPSHDWIHVDQSTEGLDISIDTVGTGTLRGSLDLKGPTGNAVIAIDVDLVSSVSQAPPGRSQGTPADQPPAPIIPVGQAEGAPTAPARHQAQQPSEWPAREQARLAATWQAGVSGRERASPVSEPRTPPQPTRRPPSPQTLQPPSRSGAAFAGLGVALLAGTAGLISNHLFYKQPNFSGTFIFFEQAVFVLPMAVAVTALVLRNHRLVTLGLLQGMWWPAASWLAWDIVGVSVKASTGSVPGYYIGAVSHALGVIAAIFLLISSNPGAGTSGTRRWGALPVMLVFSASVSQIAGLFLYQSPAFSWAPHAFYTQGVAAVVVGLAVSGYAVSLRSRTLGGALLLGWTTTTAIFLISTVMYGQSPSNNGPLTGVGTASSFLEFALLAATLILTIVYMSGTTRPAPEPPRAVASRR